MLESDFKALIKTLRPSPALLDVSSAMFQDEWSRRMSPGEETARRIKQSIQQIDRDREKLLDRIVDASTISVAKAFERRVEKLGCAKLVADRQAFFGAKRSFSACCQRRRNIHPKTI